jgi:cytoskeletal protein CcmA (bactofilin family)
MSFFRKAPDQKPVHHKQPAGAAKPVETSKPSDKPREKMNRSVSPGEQDMSIIAPGMHVVGDLITEGTVRIEGHVEGTIRAGRSVVLGKEGQVVGDIFTQDAIIGGRVQGTITADNRLELQNTAIIDGEIRARAQHLQLDEGATFNGQVRMMDEEKPPIRALPAEAASSLQQV